jgi:DNA-binding MarR family transcriptional regulator
MWGAPFPFGGFRRMAQVAKASSLLTLLHRASQRADNLFVRHVGETGLTPRQFAVLHAVSENDGLSQTDIMAATGIDRSSTADLVRRLVTSGCLQRRRTRRDARVYAVRLTPKGQQMVAIGVPAAAAADQALSALLPQAQRLAFLQALSLIVPSHQ